MDKEAIRREAFEEAAKLCDFYGEERLTLAGDTVLLDPCLGGKGFTPENIAVSERLSVEGCVHSASYHAASQLAAHIRALK